MFIIMPNKKNELLHRKNIKHSFLVSTASLLANSPVTLGALAVVTVAVLALGAAVAELLS